MTGGTSPAPASGRIPAQPPGRRRRLARAVAAAVLAGAVILAPTEAPAAARGPAFVALPGAPASASDRAVIGSSAALPSEPPTALLGERVVGPMSLAEHVLWFVVLSLMVFLVYHGLRTDSLRQAVGRGLHRWLVFSVGTALLGVAFHLFTRWL